MTDCLVGSQLHAIFCLTLIYRLVHRFYTVNTKRSPLRLLLIYQQCMKFYTSVSQKSIQLTIVVEIYRKMTKLCYVNQDTPIYQRFELVFTSSLSVVVKKAGLLVMR